MLRFCVPVLVAVAAVWTSFSACAMAQRASIWTGAYAGINLGMAAGESDFAHRATGDFVLLPGAQENLAALGSGTQGSSGLLAGIQIGYNWQSSKLVIGIEGDLQHWDVLASGERPHLVYFPSVPVSATAAFSQSTRSNYLATLRVRAGVSLDKALLYVTGGLAVTHYKFSQSVLFGPLAPSTASGSAEGTRLGFALGAGWEWAVNEHWRVRGEYLYVAFDGVAGRLSNSDAALSTFTHTVKDDLSSHIVRLGLNYKFRAP